jgi:phosphonopyruvate decarboxylase
VISFGHGKLLEEQAVRFLECKQNTIRVELSDDGVYATTGGQPVPNAQNINYAGMAKEAGYAAAYQFDDLEEFVLNVEDILKQTGPVFIAIKVVTHVENEPIGRRERRPVRSRPESVKALQQELGISGS